MRRALYVLATLLALALIATGCVTGGLAPNEPEVVDEPRVEDMPDEPNVVVGSSDACDVAGAGAAMKAGSVSVSVPTYPCEVDRTFKKLDDLEKREGRTLGLVWWSRLFLQTRLITRGIFSSVFGIVGVG